MSPAVINLTPSIRCVRAPNPSPMTYTGTNTYIVGTGSVCVIDPGPALPAHLEAILATLEAGERISHIVVTHTHLDHSPLAAPLSDRTGAPVLAFGTHEDGRTEHMQSLANAGLVGGGEGIDRMFRPDERISDGDVIEGDTWSLDVLHVPGHTANHICLAFDSALFSGDHVMGWASTLVSPPDGDLTTFMTSCERLLAREDRAYYPGHGDPVEDPAERLRWLIAHRKEREKQILDHLGYGPAYIADLTRRIYTDTPAALLPAAERNVLAHLVDLHQRGTVKTAAPISASAQFTLAL